MRRAITILVLCVVSCRVPPPATPPLPSTPPPPPPLREVNAALVSGEVVTSRGMRVAYADVRIAATGPGCRGISEELGVISDAAGEFHAQVDRGVGPAHEGCVVVTARSGDAAGSATAAAFFTAAKEQRVPVRVTVTLAPAEPLTLSRAETIVRELAEAINNPASSGPATLALYLNGGSEALRVATEHYRSILGRVTAVEPVPVPTHFVSPAFSFRLVGSSEATARIHVVQEDLTRVHSLLLDYGMRSEAFMIGYARSIGSGDAVALARLLTADDIDFPVERAREMITDYRQRYDTATLRPEFVSADEERQTITWRLSGRTPSGETRSETIVLITGDGLIEIKGLR